jgi:hypothetical protein
MNLQVISKKVIKKVRGFELWTRVGIEYCSVYEGRTRQQADKYHFNYCDWVPLPGAYLSEWRMAAQPSQRGRILGGKMNILNENFYFLFAPYIYIIVSNIRMFNDCS